MDGGPETVNVDPFFSVLVAVPEFGLTYADFRSRRPDGTPTISLDECCDLHETLIVKAEHRRLAEEEARREAEKARGRAA